MTKNIEDLPCFKNGDILLRPFKDKERPCGGHVNWLRENDSKNKSL
jgi:hypothetical protein